MVSHSRARSLLVLLIVLILAACGGSTSTAPGPVVRPTTEVVASDEVPSLQELRDIGYTDEDAECFLEIVDPDSTGRIRDADLFLEALTECGVGG